MEERGNKTIMCSVLFLDIVEYSKKSVAGQISLKDRFNSYISAAIGDVPLADRIILDTGDGAAINFIGDIEDALKAALSLRESMLKEDATLDPPLLVRAGINLGPVRLVRDINGQPNIVGDGINVAQRVMGFAEAGQILVSRSYYDAVSRLSPQYAGMFHYQGSRTDKHVREHEVYAIGYPGDKTAQAAGGDAGQATEPRAEPAWRVKLGNAVQVMRERFRQAEPEQRNLFVVVAAIVPVLVAGVVVLKLVHNSKAPALSGTDQVRVASSAQPASAVVPEDVVAHPVEHGVPATGQARPDATPRQDMKKVADGKPPAAKKAPEARVDSRKAAEHAKPAETQPHKGTTTESGKGWFAGSTEAPPLDARITVTCDPGTQVFVDGAQKGKLTSGVLSVDVTSGKHMVIVNSVKGEIHTQSVELEPHKTVNIKPKFCIY